MKNDQPNFLNKHQEIWNASDNKLHNFIIENIFNYEEVKNLLLHTSYRGIFTAWSLVCKNNNNAHFIDIFIKLEKYDSYILFGILICDEITIVNREKIEPIFKDLVLQNEELSKITKDNYCVLNYYLSTKHAIPPAMDTSLNAITKGFKNSILGENKDMLLVISSYLDINTYKKLFQSVLLKNVIEKVGSYINKLYNKGYEFLYKGCCSYNEQNLEEIHNRLFEEPRNKFGGLFYWMSTEEIDGILDGLAHNFEEQKEFINIQINCNHNNYIE